MAGYSKRSLQEKLGLKDGMRAAVLNSIENYKSLIGFEFDHELGGDYNFVQFFTTKKEELENKFPALKKSIKQNGMLWISWPKGTSKIPTDLSENIIREIGLSNGLVDVKVIAVDDDWSGLKFVYRLKDRS